MNFVRLSMELNDEGRERKKDGRGGKGVIYVGCARTCEQKDAAAASQSRPTTTSQLHEPISPTAFSGTTHSSPGDFPMQNISAVSQP